MFVVDVVQILVPFIVVVVVVVVVAGDGDWCYLIHFPTCLLTVYPFVAWKRVLLRTYYCLLLFCLHSY